MPSGAKIPDCANPYRAIVNGVEHVYEAGAETEVADGVEELINAADNFPPAAEKVQPPFAGGLGGGVLVVEHIEGDENDYINATAKELIDALGEGKLIFLRQHEAGSDAPAQIYGREFIGVARKRVVTGEVVFNSMTVTLDDTSPEVAITVWRAATENDKPVADYGA